MIIVVSALIGFVLGAVLVVIRYELRGMEDAEIGEKAVALLINDNS